MYKCTGILLSASENRLERLASDEREIDQSVGLRVEWADEAHHISADKVCSEVDFLRRRGRNERQTFVGDMGWYLGG